MLYENTTCPVCEKEFAQGDDIVVCPDCGTPHHRACWQQIGACSNAQRHSDGYVFAAPAVSHDHDDETEPQESDSSEQSECPACGAQCSKTAIVCPECGTSLGFGRPFGAGQPFNEDAFMNGIDIEPNEDIGGVTARQAAQYVQVRARKYIPKFVAMEQEGKKFSWNWSAFLISPFWFFYRKLFKEGIIFLGLSMVIILFSSIPLSDVYDEMAQTVASYISVTDETTVDELMTDFNALGTVEQEAIINSAKSCYTGVLLTAAALMLPNILAALLSTGMYRNKVIRDIKLIKANALDAQAEKMLTLRRGGISFFALFLSYLALNMFIDVLLSL